MVAERSDVKQCPTVRMGRRVSAGAVAVALLGTVACGGSSKPKAAATTTTSTTVAPTTTTVDATKAAILAAYRAGWADYIALAETFPVRPLDPRLAAHAMGKQLTSAQQALTRLSLLNHYNRGPTDLAPVVTAVEANTATVTDCIFDHSVEVDYRTNTPVEQPDLGHTLNKFTMTLVNGTWFVSDSTIISSGKRKDACVPTT